VRLTGQVSSQTKMELCKVSQDLQHPGLGSLANPSSSPWLCVGVRKGNSECGGVFINPEVHTPLRRKILQAKG